MFSVGEKVVAVNVAKQPHTIEELNIDVPNWIVKGKIYTIRQINDYDFVQSLLLEEVVNPMKYFKVLNKVVEPGFLIERFRKLQPDEVEVKEEQLETVI
jgi:predicted ThiF/HesA family dinucleotide-utilizing enzyme